MRMVVMTLHIPKLKILSLTLWAVIMMCILSLILTYVIYHITYEKAFNLYWRDTWFKVVNKFAFVILINELVFVYESVTYRGQDLNLLVITIFLVSKISKRFLKEFRYYILHLYLRQNAARNFNIVKIPTIFMTWITRLLFMFGLVFNFTH